MYTVITLRQAKGSTAWRLSVAVANKNNIAHLISVYLQLVGIRLRSQMSYRRSFAIEIIAHFFQMAMQMMAIFFIFTHVKLLDGWSLWEIIYLYGVTSFAFVTAQLIGEGFEDFHLYIKSGEFDQMLTKPISPLIQIAAISFRLERMGGFLQTIIALAVATFKLEIFADIQYIVMFVVSILSMIVVYYGLFLANGALTFFAVEATTMFNAFTYGGIEVAKYPLSIYHKWMQSLFLYCIPLGFVSYLPATLILDKNVDLDIYTPHAIYSPLIAFVFLILMWAVWRLGLRNYQSTGS